MASIRRPSVRVFVVALLLAAGQSTVASPSAAPAERRVLFVGNSYTYSNNLPVIFRDLAEAAGLARRVQITMLVDGGRTLAEAWADTTLQTALREQPWDVVVLQEQSGFGTSYFVDGTQVLRDGGTLPAAAERFVAWARDAGAEPLLIAHWPKRDAASRDRQVRASTFCSVARATGVRLARVDLAWESALAGEAPPLLYAEDGSHPTSSGSYLTALTLLATLGVDLPGDLPGTIFGHPVDPGSGEPIDHGRAALVDLDDPERRRLRDAASSVASSTGCATPVATPPPPTDRELPAGLAAASDDLLGTWRGETRFYPRDMLPSPGIVRLTFTRGEHGLMAAVEVRFDGSSFTESADAMPVTIDGGEIRFTNPGAIEGGSIDYRARLTAPGRLDGVAELRGAGDPTLALSGRWSATRAP